MKLSHTFVSSAPQPKAPARLIELSRLAGMSLWLNRRMSLWLSDFPARPEELSWHAGWRHFSTSSLGRLMNRNACITNNKEERFRGDDRCAGSATGSQTTVRP